jgi:mannan endo-1,4-beta-mannosidase
MLNDRLTFGDAITAHMKPTKSLTTLFVLAAGALGAFAVDVPSTGALPAEKRPLLEDVRTFMVDPQATPETVALFFNLKKVAKRGHTLLGQQDPEQSVKEPGGEMAIKRMTGSDPAVWGSDFMGITCAANTNATGWLHDREKKIIGMTSAAYDKGMFNIFCWHFQDPYEQKSFMSKELRPETLEKSFRSLLPGGEKHEWYKGKLKKVAEVVGSIKGADGRLSPVIFRPFHEFDGSWFWWGKPYCTPQEFQACWRFTVTYLRDELKVRNLLYAFSPDCSFKSEEEYLERYPGDAYVDLVGFDDYNDFENNRIAEAASKLAIISNYAKKHSKLAALTEVGYRKETVPPNLYTGYYGAALADPSLEIAFMMFWRQKKDGPEYFVPYPGCETADDFKRFAGNTRMRLLSGLENLYTLEPRTVRAKEVSRASNTQKEGDR